ncbi:PLP-dependent aminotransferase family protein [Pseudomonas sp. NPDC078700]|uniref:MocR-like pyridoxine biosynthesis transcription factor PdxR n=1 Tax=Pseudomonas sp. NPDC078700 TaxID=3364424 RepID=UPI0037C77A7A
MQNLHIELNRATGVPIAAQISTAIGASIRSGRLYSGARLPSWRDLSAQLGVARGTVRVAYERLIDEQLIVSRGAAGTFVAHQLPLSSNADIRDLRSPLPDFFVHPFSQPPLMFQMGVPAQDMFPVSLWSRLTSAAAREAATVGSVSYPDPRGELALRTEIAAYLSVARGLSCSPAQIIITNGYTGALGLIIHALGLIKQTAWVEEPGYPLTRTALAIAGLDTVSIAVDEQGINVDNGIARAPDAALAVVTAGQQAPLGMTLSLSRRHQLLEWAGQNNSWIIEDDYLSELQLYGRAAPALASLDRYGRVIHIGTFSKTVSPALRMGFISVPAEHTNHFADVAAALAPASSIVTQLALAQFMRKGHYMRHLRRMKRIYKHRLELLRHSLQIPAATEAMAGLALLLKLPRDTDDKMIAQQAAAFDLAPTPLSSWYAQTQHKQSGLLLGVTNITETGLDANCEHLRHLIAQSS